MKLKLFLIALFTQFVSITVMAETNKITIVDGIYYELDTSNCTASVSFDRKNIYRNRGGDVVIPSSIIHEKVIYRVTAIQMYAFNECHDLTSVSIPNSVTYIGSWAFGNCHRLTSITIPDNVTSIGSHAFRNCDQLTSVTLGNKVSNIGLEAFECCFSLNSIVIPNSVTTIDFATFRDCRGLTSVTIGNKVKSIKAEAFSGCRSLTFIYIPVSITNIDESAFEGCNLTSIVVDEWNTKYDSRDKCNAIIETATNTLVAGSQKTIIPTTVTSIGKYAFYGRSSLSSIIIPSSVNSIGRSAFEGCSNLTSINVDIWNSVYDSRNGCNAIIETASNTLITGCQNTIIPKDVTSIGHYAFSGCSNLTSIIIPKSITNINISIAQSPFKGCSSLTSIVVEDGNTIYDSRNGCNAIIETASNTLVTGCKNTIIPEDITCIGNNAFNGRTSMTSIIIPPHVTFIGYGAFDDCPSLTDMYLYPEEVPDCGSMFNDGYLHESITMHVPSNAIDKYKDIWDGRFANIVPLTDEEVGIEQIEDRQSTMDNEGGTWYTLDGKKLNGRPANKGLFIQNGKKVLMK